MYPLPYLAEDVLFQDINLWEVFNLTKFIIFRFGRKIIQSHLFFSSWHNGFLKTLLESSCFTMLCQLLLYTEVNQLHIYIQSPSLRFPTHLSHHRAFSRVPCSIKQVHTGYLFYYYFFQLPTLYSINSVYISIPTFQFICPAPIAPVTISLLSTSVSLFLL